MELLYQVKTNSVIIFTRTNIAQNGCLNS